MAWERIVRPEEGARDIVKVHVSRLRQKLEADPVAGRCIINVRGQGYKYVFERRGADPEAGLPRLSIL
jgi:DNA-binding response OmpR family regulator